MPFRWRGREEMRRAIDRAEREFLSAIRAGVTESVAEIQGQASLMAPVDEGVLRASGSFFVDGQFKGDTGPSPKARGGPNRQADSTTARRPGFIRGVVGFNVPYAAVQHEKKFRHPKGGTDKYLEKAIKKTLPKIPKVLKRMAKARGF